MTDDVALIIQVPADSAVDRQLELDPPPSVAGGRAVIERIIADVEGTIQPPAAGQVVLSFLSPEDLRREADQIRQEIRPGDGGQPPVVVVDVAEELREDELAVLLQAAEEASRVVILCILGSVLDEVEDGVQRGRHAGESPIRTDRKRCPSARGQERRWRLLQRFTWSYIEFALLLTHINVDGQIRPF